MLVLCVFMSITLTANMVFAEDEITVKKVYYYMQYDRPFIFTDQSGKMLPTFEYNDSVYVPLRSFCRYLRKNVKWSEYEIEIEDISEDEYAETIYGERQNYEEVSIIELIACPEKYDGKNVSVRGVINVGFESDMLFLTTEDRKYWNVPNGISWNVPLGYFGEATDLMSFYDKVGDISGAYVEIEGKFYASPKNYPHGVLSDVKSIYCLPKLIN